MVKKMNKRKMMVRGAAVFVTLAAMAVIVRALIRKRRPRITYGPMHERDRIRFDYLNQKNWQSDVLCKNMLSRRVELCKGQPGPWPAHRWKPNL
uniref:Uncharacterized protein n=1 Tax=Triticum urartu TaxID=4572 RepID=A0A8R7K0D9_TRIUA